MRRKHTYQCSVFIEQEGIYLRYGTSKHILVGCRRGITPVSEDMTATASIGVASQQDFGKGQRIATKTQPIAENIINPCELDS